MARGPQHDLERFAGRMLAQLDLFIACLAVCTGALIAHACIPAIARMIP